MVSSPSSSTSAISYFKDEYVAKVVSRFLGQDATKENESIDPDVGKKECKDDTNVKKDRPSRNLINWVMIALSCRTREQKDKEKG